MVIPSKNTVATSGYVKDFTKTATSLTSKEDMSAQNEHHVSTHIYVDVVYFCKSWTVIIKTAYINEKENFGQPESR